MNQRTLDFIDERSLDEQFAAYHRARPDVYSAFIRAAKRLKAAGERSYGAKAIFEALRYGRAIRGKDSSGYAVDNRMISRYSRKAMREHESLRGFFHTRVLKTADEGRDE